LVTMLSAATRSLTPESQCTVATDQGDAKLDRIILRRRIRKADSMLRMDWIIDSSFYLADRGKLLIVKPPLFKE